MSKILKLCAFGCDKGPGHRFVYRCPSALCTGDIVTLYPTLTCTPNDFFNQLLQHVYLPCKHGKRHKNASSKERFGLDVAYQGDGHASPHPSALPKGAPTPTVPPKIVCFVAGIGGGPSSPYIVEPATRFLAKGWAVVILIPRGMLDSKVQRVQNAFDPGMQSASV
jgi:predicted alpha/beta-fold hydrolase